ncbi:MAG TPA: translesion error-prone DNA polymerase V autoproteolytic subunit [Stellaceae bacterium]|nr:translesion error-prone DNA polymerase V autoproteolytic subunit [Stellaceae bacterium]
MFETASPLSRHSVALFEAPRPAAGFPSPAADYVEGSLDLNQRLIARPAATFILRVSGDSMRRAGIHSGDLAIVDRSITPRSGQIVVATLNGEFVVKRLRRRARQIWLEPDSDDPLYRPIEIGEDSGLEIWGVVTHTIRDHPA